jgi:hypothetical protein
VSFDVRNITGSCCSNPIIDSSFFLFLFRCAHLLVIYICMHVLVGETFFKMCFSVYVRKDSTI